MKSVLLQLSIEEAHAVQRLFTWSVVYGFSRSDGGFVDTGCQRDVNLINRVAGRLGEDLAIAIPEEADGPGEKVDVAAKLLKSKLLKRGRDIPAPSKRTMPGMCTEKAPEGSRETPAGLFEHPSLPKAQSGKDETVGKQLPREGGLLDAARRPRTAKGGEAS